MNQIPILPRFVTLSTHNPTGNINEYDWDKEKIYVDQSLIGDILMLQNVFEGSIISPNIYPLIYDKKKESSLRSLEFYREVEKDHKLYTNLPNEEKI